MPLRHPAPPAAGPWAADAQAFDDLVTRRNPREALRRSLAGVLRPAERNKTLTALAHAAPITGAQHAAVHSLPWFLSESTWDAAAVTARRVAVRCADPATAPDDGGVVWGVVVIDDTGDRKWGTQTAHGGRQELGRIGKVDRGVVTVRSRWADERVSWPLTGAPFTPTQHFPRGMSDPAYRTTPPSALAVVPQAVADGVPVRAVVADRVSGATDPFRSGRHGRGGGSVRSLKRETALWAPVGAVGSRSEAAGAAAWAGP